MPITVRSFIPELFLIISWISIQVYLGQSLGIKIMEDSYRYISNAQYIVVHNINMADHNSRYLGYSLFMALCLNFKNSYLIAVAIQIIISGVALLAFYLSVVRLSCSRMAAIIASSLFIYWPELSSWNFYILTESLFISFTLIIFCLLLYSNKGWQYFICLIALSLILILRPNGFIPVSASAVFLFTKLWVNNPSNRNQYLFAISFFCLCTLILLDRYLLKTYAILNVYKRGDIIFGYWDLLVKPNTTRVPNSSSSLLNIILFFFQNLTYFLKAGLLKIFYFLAHIKPFYSWAHNMFIIVFLFPIYLFAIIARPRREPGFLFIYTLIGLQTIMVFITTEDWDGRFLMPILPFIFILSAVEIVRRIKNYVS